MCVCVCVCVYNLWASARDSLSTPISAQLLGSVFLRATVVQRVAEQWPRCL